MKFYKELSKVYDIVFPKDETTLKFLCKNLKGNSKILDLACGTGSYSIALGQKGHRVDAIDLGEEMIQIAKVKGGLYVNFLHEDMNRIKTIFQDSKYDFIYCIGNSIVHLENKEKIQKFLKNMHDILNLEGTVVIQIINYDRIINDKVDSLPTIDRPEKGVKFIRKYNYLESHGKVEFNTELIIKNGEAEETYHNSAPLIALRYEEFLEMLQKAGFSKIEAYGDFDEEEYNNKSYALVVRAYK